MARIEGKNSNIDLSQVRKMEPVSLTTALRRPNTHTGDCSCDTCHEFYRQRGEATRKQSPRATRGDSFAKKVAEIFGLQPGSVRAMDFRLRLGEPMVVKVECVVSAAQEGELVSAMEEYRVVPDSGSGEYVYDEADDLDKWLEGNNPQYPYQQGGPMTSGQRTPRYR